MAPGLLLTALAAALAAAPDTTGKGAPPATLRGELAAAAQKARTAFMAGTPVNTAVPDEELSRLEALPEMKEAERTKWDGVSALEAYKRLTETLVEAARVQEQGLAPDGPQGPEKLKLALVRGLSLDARQVFDAERRYLRPAGAPTTPEGRALMQQELKKLEAAMANPRLPPAERSRLSSQMNRIAAGLRWDPSNGAGTGGDTVLASFGGSGTSGPLTRADYTRLNAANTAPGPNTLRSQTIPMPSASPFAERARRAAERSDRARVAQESRRQGVLNEAEKESQAVEGIASDAYRFWDQMDKRGGWFGTAAGKTMKGLLTVSGLTAVERASARAGYLAGSDDVRGGDKAKALASMGGNMALSALNFVPAAGMTSRLIAGERSVTLIRSAGAGVQGVRAAAPEAATAIRDVGGKIDEAVRAAIPSGTKPSNAQLETLIGSLNETGNAYGVQVKIGGVVGESQSVGGVVTASLAKGAPHEVTHVTQQVFNNIAALERTAASQKVAVAALSPEARAAAFAEARAMEQAGYLQHEAQAFYATGFGGGGRVQYADRLRESVAHLTQSNVAGTVVGGRYGAAATAYGATGALLGDSQKLLFLNGYWASANLIYPALNGATNAGLDYLLDAQDPAPPPPPRAKR